MKNTLIILSFFTWSSILYAQNTFSVPQTIVQGKTFACNISNVEPKTLYILNTTDNMEEGNSTATYGCPEMTNAKEAEAKLINAVINEVLGEDRLSQIISNNSREFLKIGLVIDTQGNVRHLHYIIWANTSITPLELYELDRKIRNIKFYVPSRCVNYFGSKNIWFSYSKFLKNVITYSNSYKTNDKKKN